MRDNNFGRYIAIGVFTLAIILFAGVYVMIRKAGRLGVSDTDIVLSATPSISTVPSITGSVGDTDENAGSQGSSTWNTPTVKPVEVTVTPVLLKPVNEKPYNGYLDAIALSSEENLDSIVNTIAMLYSKENNVVAHCYAATREELMSIGESALYYIEPEYVRLFVRLVLTDENNKLTEKLCCFRISYDCGILRATMEQ